MMTKITLIRNTEFSREKNFNVADFSTYLTNRITAGTFKTKEITNVAYIKPEFVITIKLNLTQMNLELTPQDYNFNYLELKHYDINGFKKPFYYYITSYEWRSSSTLLLTCEMDTLNTFDVRPASNQDIVFSKRTKVVREHKDRWKAVEVWGQYKSLDDDPPFDGDDAIFSLNLSDYNDHPELFPWVYAIYSLGGNDYQVIIRTGIGSDNTAMLQAYDEWDWRVVVANNGLYHDEIEILREDYYDDDGDIGFEVEFIVRGQSSNFDVYAQYQARVLETQIARDIDIYSEGLSPVLYKEELGLLRDELDTNFYIVYQASNNIDPDTTQPISGYIYTEGQYNISYSTASKEVAVNDLLDNQYLVFSNSYNSAGFTLERDGVTYSTSMTQTNIPIVAELGSFVKTSIFTCYVIKRNNTNLELFRIVWVNAITYYLGVQRSNDWWIQEQRLMSSGVSNISINTEETSIQIGKHSGSFPQKIPSKNYEMQFTALTSYLNPFSVVDKASQKISKILKLPYSPVEYELTDTGAIEFKSTLTFDDQTHNLLIFNLDTPFERVVKTSLDNPIASVLNPVEYSSIGIDDVRNDYFESKLYQSPFYQIKFAYDSFTFIFQLENIDWEGWYVNHKEKFNFTFIPTTTMNSKMLFRFDEYVLRYSTEDYDNILTVSRNNEVVIYNSVYLNYLRTSYNYDLKAKERTIRTAKANAVLGSVGAIASLGVSMATGSVAGQILAPINAASSLANTLIGTANTIAQAEESLASKMAVLQNESVSVSGSDDVDLLQAYSQNRAKMMIYKVSERLRKALADMFYFCGYATNEMKIPDIYTRRHFNFVACELEVEAVRENSISDDVIANIKAKFQNGVTFIHKYFDENDKPQWDIKQEKSNIETFIVDLQEE